jgi:hypothetical protein
MKFINPIKITKSFLLEPLKFYYDILRGLGALRIEDIDLDDDKTIIINDYYENIYCLEIAGAGESVGFLPKTLIDTLSTQYKDDETGELTWVLIKDDIFRKNLIFTRNKSLAEQIEASTYSIMLTFDDIFNRILSLYFHNEYTIDWYKRELKQKHDIDLEQEFVNPINQMNNLIKERANANYHKVKYFQATSYEYGLKEEDIKFDINKFFGINFKGALFTKILFSKERMKQDLEHQKFNSSIAKFSAKDKNTIKKLIESIDTQNRLMINTTLMVFDDSGKDISTSVESAANCKLDIVSRDSRDLNNQTPILKNNRNFTRVVNRHFLYNYISYNTKLDSDKPHLVGTNSSDSYTNFGFKKATAKNSIPKPHTILLGTSGAGKTQAANDIFKQLLGYDYENKIIHHLNETNHVIFDIKDSFYNLVKKIKEEFPEKVDMNDFNKNEFIYNIVDCETFVKSGKKQVEESDLDFSSTLISLILASGDGGTKDALSSAESEEFKSALREVYIKNNYDRLAISEIRDSHPKEYKAIRELGYKEFTPFDEIKEKEFEKFQKPLLHNVINLLKQRERHYSIKNRDMEVNLLQALTFKLETIEKMGIFSSFSKLSFKKKEIIYFRTDTIVGGNDYGYLVFAMQSILAKQIKKEQHKKRLEYKGPPGVQYRPLWFFWYEEARNIFSNKLFRDKEVFERVINEWRSFDMVFFPITQEPQHIPDSILNGFEIKMILTAGDDEDEKNTLINNLSKRLSIGEKRKEILKDLPKYTMMVMYGDGAFTFKFKDDPEFRALVNT